MKQFKGPKNMQKRAKKVNNSQKKKKKKNQQEKQHECKQEKRNYYFENTDVWRRRKKKRNGHNIIESKSYRELKRLAVTRNSAKNTYYNWSEKLTKDEQSPRTWKIGSMFWRLEEELKPLHYYNRLRYFGDSWDLRRLAVTRTPVKEYQSELVEKNRLVIMIMIRIICAMTSAECSQWE